MASQFRNATNTYVERADDGTWCVCALIEGERRLISRHASEELAKQASDGLPATAESHVRSGAFGTTQDEPDHPGGRSGEALR
jgi:DNA/RNA-binding domain of Phe-tRNA-synthetase-like protein